ncbi:MAG: phosphoribosylamine--glycine ligase, partial [Candidatus Puniceispirillum sp.]
MNILLIGSGGREHALAWSLAESPLTTHLLIAPGTPGMAPYGTLHDIAADDLDGLCRLANDIAADLVVIGPEVPLVMGLADRLEEMGIAAFGPSAAAARLEGSKEFARAFCARHNVPQPAYYPVTDYDEACRHIDALGGRCVIKADGLAAGKGVVVADDGDMAKQAAKDMLAG